MKPTYVLAVLGVVVACAGFKSVIRTADDIASDLCVLFAVDNKSDIAERYNLTPQQWCAVKENFQPFIDDVLQLRRTQGVEMGVRLNGAPTE